MADHIRCRGRFFSIIAMTGLTCALTACSDAKSQGQLSGGTAGESTAEETAELTTAAIADYPAAIMVNGKIYRWAYKSLDTEIDESDILGVTRSYTDTFPEKNGETNFDRELGMPYAQTEGGIAVWCEGRWQLCVPEEGQSQENLSERESVEAGQQETKGEASPAAKSFEEVRAYLAGFSGTPEELVEEGCFVVSSLGTESILGGLDRWNDFCAAAEEGRRAEVVLVQFTVEGDPILDYLSFDGEGFYHVSDWTRDAFAGTEKYHEERLPYLKIFDRESQDGDCLREVLLTSDEGLTLEKWNQIADAEGASISFVGGWQYGDAQSDGKESPCREPAAPDGQTGQEAEEEQVR